MSKELEAFESLKILFDLLCEREHTGSEHFFWEKQYNICKQSLIKAQEQEKVLKIIINKDVSVWGFRNRVFGYQKEQNGNITINDTYEYYLNNFGCYHNGFDFELLTEEEFKKNLI